MGQIRYDRVPENFVYNFHRNNRPKFCYTDYAVYIDNCDFKHVDHDYPVK